MGEFITRGIGIGFAAGVTTALIARRYPLTRRHPNLIGFAAAGTADAISRDYRRPMVYDKLLKLDTPLANRAQSILFSIRSGRDEHISHADTSSSYLPPKTSLTSEPSSSTTPPPQSQPDWWVPEASHGEDHSASSETLSTDAPRTSTNLYSSTGAAPPSSEMFKGTRTWEEIRKSKEGSSESSRS